MKEKLQGKVLLADLGYGFIFVCTVPLNIQTKSRSLTNIARQSSEGTITASSPGLLCRGP